MVKGEGVLRLKVKGVLRLKVKGSTASIGTMLACQKPSSVPESQGIHVYSVEIRLRMLTPNGSDTVPRRRLQWTFSTDSQGNFQIELSQIRDDPYGSVGRQAVRMYLCACIRIASAKCSLFLFFSGGRAFR